MYMPWLDAVYYTLLHTQIIQSAIFWVDRDKLVAP